MVCQRFGEAEEKEVGDVLYVRAHALEGLFSIVPELTSREVTYFATRIAEFTTSSDARRLGQYEGFSWWDFVRAERYGDTPTRGS